ncbi:MAG TPA: hypothetical protein VFY59_04985 [Rubrobacter sp.]|nr:hypothetical protein [Rubrobacter sp.]
MSATVAGRGTGMKRKQTLGPPGHENARMSLRAAALLARAVCVLSLALAGAGLLLLAANRIYLGVPVFEEWVEDTVIAVGFSTVGAVIAHRFPSRNPIGWLFCALGLVAAVLLFCGEYAVYAMVAGPWSLPGGEAAAWIVTWLWVVHSGLFAFLGLLFPDGRLPTARWRYFAWTVVVVVVFGTVTTAFSPGHIDSLSLISNPLGIEGAPDLHNAVEVFVFALTLAAAASVLVRLYRADGVERLQIKWFAYSASVLAVGALISWVVSDAVDARWLRWDVGFVVTVTGLAGLPVALGIAILRYRLHDIDLIVNQALVYAALTAILAGVFEITLVIAQHVLLTFTHVEDSRLAYFATAMVMAAMFEPLKRRIDIFVEGYLLRKDDEDGEQTVL